MTRDEAMALRARGSAALLAKVTAPVDYCTERDRAVYGATLVGITHYADRWERDDDGTLVLVMEPRGGRVDGGGTAA